jgi:hypothetical protein
MSTIKIQYLDSIDGWGSLDATDEDRAAYEQSVCDAIAAAYPGADVNVTSRSGLTSMIVTTRDAAGTILLDVATALAEEDIEETCKHIAAEIWDNGEFWGAAEADGDSR